MMEAVGSDGEAEAQAESEAQAQAHEGIGSIISQSPQCQ